MQLLIANDAGTTVAVIPYKAGDGVCQDLRQLVLDMCERRGRGFKADSEYSRIMMDVYAALAVEHAHRRKSKKTPKVPAQPSLYSTDDAALMLKQGYKMSPVGSSVVYFWNASTERVMKFYPDRPTECHKATNYPGSEQPFSDSWRIHGQP